MWLHAFTTTSSLTIRYLRLSSRSAAIASTALRAVRITLAQLLRFYLKTLELHVCCYVVMHVLHSVVRPVILCVRYRIGIVMLGFVGRVQVHAVSKRHTQIERSHRTRQSGSSSLRNERNTMIRQAISCDICGAQRRETNHWFIAYEQSGELRVSGWNFQRLHCPGTKHLCGENCLHKLLDEFLAGSAQARTLDAAAVAAPQSVVASVDTSVPAARLVSRHLQAPLTSTFSRWSQHANRAMKARRRKCGGRRTS